MPPDVMRIEDRIEVMMMEHVEWWVLKWSGHGPRWIQLGFESGCACGVGC